MVTLAALGYGPQAPAQSVDALLDKLVDKGILTVREANDLKQESDKNFTAALQTKTGLPDWVTSPQFHGDLRGRVDQISSDNLAWTDRARYRYRARLGVTATLWDDFEVGLRLTSGDPSGSQGGNPLSNNSTLQWNGSKKFLWLDLAYAKWTAIHNGDWTLSGTIGKMENPFQTPYMVFDPDYMPEGASLQLAYSPSSSRTLKLNAAAFVLGEISRLGGGYSPSRDPLLGGAQLLWEARWSPKIESSVSVSAYGISGVHNLDNALVPNVNDGNTRNASGQLVYIYNPIVGGGSLTYKLASFPFYAGEFPIKVGGEFMNNPGAPNRNSGYWAGATFGKSGKKKTWDGSYRYQRLEADAWYEELVDDDNGAFYQAAAANTGFTSSSNPSGFGWRAGTNVKGHFIKANYSFTDYLTFTFSYYLNDLIDPNPKGSISQSSHLMADVMLKF